MEIPIQNIYYLLCYAWDKLEEKEIVNVNATTCNNVVDLFARVLINGITHVFKNGLDRNYIQVSGAIQGIKGKVNFGNALKQNLFAKAQAFCEFDELDHNVLHNQIVKASVGNLIQVKNLDADLRSQLRALYHKFHGVDHIRISTQDFSRINLHRNNCFYDFLLKVCRILHDNILITEEEGPYKFKDFIRDEVRMRMVFEKFVRNFYRKHQQKYKVRSEIIQWNALALENSSTEVLPLMKTDVSLESENKKIIIDTKYYVETLALHYDKEKIRSGHLYQLFAYLKNLETKGGTNTGCEGILLYPTVSRELAEKFDIQGHKLSICTVNLNQHWRQVHSDLLELIA